MLNRVQFTVGPAVGEAGLAQAVGQSIEVSGLVQSVGISFDGTPAATTDVALADLNDGLGDLIVALPNVTLGKRVYPARQMQTNLGADIEGLYGSFAVHGPLEGALTQTNPGVSVTFDVVIRMY